MNVVVLFYVVLVGFILMCTAEMSFNDNKTEMIHMMKFLSRYGYMKPMKDEEMATMDRAKMIAPLQLYQKFYGLNPTGKMDKETKKMMEMPRCGMKDIISRRRKRYIIAGTRWEVKDVTYRITKYPREFPRSRIDKIIQDAFNVWSEVIDLNFKAETANVQVNLQISFENGDHGDGNTFDGPNGVLAHAFIPDDGRIHFDNAEKWMVYDNSENGIQLFQVAVHEFGHALGLLHSPIQSAVMYPAYRGYIKDVKLDQDDISGITAIYKNRSFVNTPKSRKYSPANICQKFKIDAIYSDPISNRKGNYIFSGDKYWLTQKRSIVNGYPKKISSNWPALPSNIDTAFMYKGQMICFFKGSQVWRYNGLKLESGFPKLISEVFPGIPYDIQAVFRWSGDFKLYFFKGHEFWIYDDIGNFSDPYPKSISDFWKGVPDNIDAAFPLNGFTYFFKDNFYYMFNGTSRTVSPGYPKQSALLWLMCKNNFEQTFVEPSQLKYSTNIKNSNQKENIPSNKTPWQDEDDTLINSSSIFCRASSFSFTLSILVLLLSYCKII